MKVKYIDKKLNRLTIQENVDTITFLRQNTIVEISGKFKNFDIEVEDLISIYE